MIINKIIIDTGDGVDNKIVKMSFRIPLKVYPSLHILKIMSFGHFDHFHFPAAHTIYVEPYRFYSCSETYR